MPVAHSIMVLQSVDDYYLRSVGAYSVLVMHSLNCAHRQIPFFICSLSVTALDTVAENYIATSCIQKLW
jgi:hypothetical protein